MSTYFDLQVNGCYGVDFNQDDLSADDLHMVCQRLDEEGVGGVLATIITASLDHMTTRLGRIVELRRQDPLVKKIIAGLHIEGPFISPVDGYRGAHPIDEVRPADVDSIKRLLEAGEGLTRIVTLAPEHDVGLKVTHLLADAGVVISAGHCNPSLEQLTAAVDAGLSMFTHLGNGCALQMHRHDNIIQHAISLADRLWPCFIGDGVHVPYAALGNYVRSVGLDRAVVVTDAMAAAGLGPGRYTVSHWDVVVGEDLAAWAPDRSHLIGAAISMSQCVKNLIEHMGLTQLQARQLTCDNPRRAIGCPPA